MLDKLLGKYPGRAHIKDKFARMNFAGDGSIVKGRGTGRYDKTGFALIEKIETGGAGCGTILIDQSILLKLIFLFFPHCSDFCD